MIADWLVFALLVAGMFLVLTLPGALLLWLIRIRDARLLLLGPTVGLGLIGLLTLASIPFGHWSLAYPLGLAVLLGIVVIWQRRSEGNAAGALRSKTASAPHIGRGVLGFSLVGVLAFLVAYLPSMGRYWDGPGSPQAKGDVVFHAQGTLLVSLSGNVNPFGAMGSLYDPLRSSDVYYPTLWHALASLFVPAVHAGEANNALIVTVGLIVWPLALSALGLAFFHGSRSMAFWVPFLASMAPGYPGLILFGYAIDAFGLSVPTVPAALAAMLWWLQGTREESPARRRWLLVWAAITIGALGAQPSSAVLIVLAAAGGAAILIQRKLWLLGRNGHGILALALTALLMGSLPLSITWFARTHVIQVLGSFVRPEIGYRSALSTLLRGGIWAGSYLPWTLILVVAIIGIVVAIRTVEGQVLMSSTVIFGLLYLASAGPDRPLRLIAGIWYKDYARLGVLVMMCLAVWGALGAAWLGDQISGRLQLKGASRFAVGASGAIVFLVASFLPIGGPRLGPAVDMEIGYSLAPNPDDRIDASKVRLIEEIDRNFPAGTYIIGPPQSGVGAVSSVSNSLSFIPLNQPRTPEQIELATGMDRILVDPHICEILRQGNIRGVMLSNEQVPEDERTAYQGLYELDPLAGGFELVATEGDTSLWKITACD